MQPDKSLWVSYFNGVFLFFLERVTDGNGIGMTECRADLDKVGVLQLGRYLVGVSVK